MKRRAAGVAALPLLYLLVCAGAWLFEPRLVYQPSRTMRSTPADKGIEFEDLTLTASDGAKIRAWFLPVESPRATVLYAHGTTGNLSTNLKRLLPMREAGFAVLAFDYRGYGASESRSLSEEDTYRDAEAAWHWLTTEKNVPPAEVVVWGRSLGGGIASHLAAQHPPRALAGVRPTAGSDLSLLKSRSRFSFCTRNLSRVRPFTFQLGPDGRSYTRSSVCRTEK